MFNTITDYTEIDVAEEVLISPVVNYKWMKSSLSNELQSYSSLQSGV